MKKIEKIAVATLKKMTCDIQLQNSWLFYKYDFMFTFLQAVSYHVQYEHWAGMSAAITDGRCIHTALQTRSQTYACGFFNYFSIRSSSRAVQ